jgi:hypothetical protein
MMHAFLTLSAPADVIANLALAACGTLPKVAPLKTETQGFCAQRKSRVCRSFAQRDTGLIRFTALACTRDLNNAFGLTQIGEDVTK